MDLDSQRIPIFPEDVEWLKNLRVGDPVTRWFALSPLDLTVTAIGPGPLLWAGPWSFDPTTGAEVDEDLGWGNEVTGSFIRRPGWTPWGPDSQTEPTLTFVPRINWASFRKAFPILFRPVKGASLECGSGWRDLIWYLSSILEPIAKAQKEAGTTPLNVECVKEKFGGLRFHCAHASHETQDLIHRVEDLSFSICEACGKPGNCISVRGWYQTLCDQHAQDALDED